MKKNIIYALIILLICNCTTMKNEKTNSSIWQKATPESIGLSSKELAGVVDFANNNIDVPCCPDSDEGLFHGCILE